MSSSPRHCSNCSGLFFISKKIGKGQKTFQELDIVAVNTQGSSIWSTIKVDAALSTIYKLNYLKDLHSIRDHLADSHNYNYTDDEDEQLAICEHCVKIFVNLIKFYNEFDRLRALDSALSKKITNLNDLIGRIPNIVNNTQDKISTTATTINNNSNNNNTTQHSDKKKGYLIINISDDDECNSLDNDVSNFMDCELQEEDDAEVNLSQIDVNEKNNNKDDEEEKSRKISFPRVPTVQVTIGENRNENEQEKEVEVEIKPELESDEEEADISSWEDDDDDDSDFVLSEEELDKSNLPSTSRGVLDSRFVTSRGRRKRIKIEEDPLSSPKRRDSSPENETTKPSKPPSKKKSRSKYTADDIEPNSVPDRKAPLKLLNGVCPQCQKSYSDRLNLVKHLWTHVETSTSPKERIICPVPECLRTFAVKESMRLHLNDHAQTQRVTCPVPNCHRKFISDHWKREHLRAHWLRGIHICETCEVIFENMKLLSKHRSTAHPDHVTNSCPSCPTKVFQTEVLLNKHFDEVHPGEKLVVCPICSYSCNRKKNLDVHLLSHLDKVFQCDLCQKRNFPSEERLRRHREVCVGQQIYSCSICGKNFTTKKTCLFHEKLHKGEVKSLKCTFEGCDKVFYRPLSLKRHVMDHTGKRPFICEQCGVGFKCAKNLKTHYLIHLGQKTLLCPTCGKKFMRDGGLKKHMLTHSDVKGYTCNECGKQFKYTESLRLHFKTQHEENQFACTICDASFPYNFMLQKHLTSAH